jgi:hypothetical protein
MVFTIGGGNDTTAKKFLAFITTEHPEHTERIAATFLCVLWFEKSLKTFGF